MTSNRPRIEGYAIVSREGMIAKSDGSFPEELKIPADQQFYQESLERASAVANGRHSAEASFDEAWHRLGIEDGILAVVGGTNVFALFLSIGYDAFFLSRTLTSIPRGRPVFPGVGNGVAVEEPFKQHGLVLRDTRMLDPASETVVQEWRPKP